MSSAFLLYFGYYNLSHGFESLGLFEVASGVLILVNLIVFLVTRKYAVTSSFYLLVVAVVFLVLFVTGGIGKTGIFWIFLYPLLITFLKEPVEAFVWNLTFTAAVVIAIVAENFGLVDLPYDELTLEQGLVVYFSILILSHFYSKLSSELVVSMKTLAVRDPLTGLYNRAFAISYLTQELEKVKRRELRNLCIAYIDLDNFKKINDLLGHSVGDGVLSDVGELLRQHFRKGDVVARIGGDEFLIIFTNCEASKLARRLDLLRTKIEDKFKKFGLSMSFGIAEAPRDALLPSFLIRVADERMYENKKKRKGVKEKKVEAVEAPDH
jgi:diguanylate cyclase (GGDEF)-like protein